MMLLMEITKITLEVALLSAATKIKKSTILNMKKKKKKDLAELTRYSFDEFSERNIRLNIYFPFLVIKNK